MAASAVPLAMSGACISIILMLKAKEGWETRLKRVVGVLAGSNRIMCVSKKVESRACSPGL